jgi:hypothetical protein
MDRSLSLGQRTNGEPPSLGDTTNAYRNLGEWRTELRRKSPWLDLKAKERQPVAISSRPEHWRADQNGARDRGLQRRNEEAVIAATWRAERGECGIAAEAVADQEFTILRAIKIGEIRGCEGGAHGARALRGARRSS